MMESLQECIELNKEQHDHIWNHMFLMYAVGYEEGSKIPVLPNRRVGQFLQDVRIRDYITLREAAQAIGGSHGSIIHAMKSNSPYKGFYWKYI